MVTPFDENQAIDFQATKQLVNKLIAEVFMGFLFLGQMVNFIC
nr:hypothetical protein [Pelosinus sp. HCF1]